MTREEAIEYWGGLRKTFPSQLEQEEKHCGRMHLQTTIDAIDMAISALQQQETVTNRNGLNDPMTNAQKTRSMSDEELAVLIAREIVHVPHSGFYVAKSAWLRWLHETVEEDEHA